LERLAL